MTEANIAADVDAVNQSQIIEPREHHETPRPGNDLPEAEPKPEKPLSTRDAIAKAFDENEKAAKDKAEKAEKVEEAKPDDKAEKAAKLKGADKDAKVKEEAEEVKADKSRSSDGKFAKADAEKGEPEQAATERRAADDSRSEGYSRPPSRYLPEATTKWDNVPSALKAEIHRVHKEFESEVENYRRGHEEWSKLEKFDQLAKQHDTTVSEALERYTRIDGMLKSNPVQAIRQVLAIAGVTPEQYAQHVIKNPQAHQAQMQPQQPEQAQKTQPDPEITELKQKLERMEAQQRYAPVFEDFSKDHPDFNALRHEMGKIMASGVIEQLYGNGLSEFQVLEQAYRMAGGRAPSRSEPPAQEEEHSEPVADRPVDLAGQKSIKGAPSAGQSGQAPKRYKTNREALEAAFANAR